MSLITNIVGGSGYNSDGSSQSGGATGGTGETNGASNQTDSQNDGTGGTGGTSSASDAGGASSNGLSQAQAVQSVETKKETTASRGPLENVAETDEARARAQASEASRSFFYERIIASLATDVEAPNVTGEPDDADADAKPIAVRTDGEAVAGLSLNQGRLVAGSSQS